MTRWRMLLAMCAVHCLADASAAEDVPGREPVQLKVAGKNYMLVPGQWMRIRNRMGFSLECELLGATEAAIEVRDSDGRVRQIRRHLIADIVVGRPRPAVPRASEPQPAASVPAGTGRPTEDAPEATAPPAADVGAAPDAAEESLSPGLGGRFLSLDRASADLVRLDLRFDLVIFDDNENFGFHNEIYGQLFLDGWGGYFLIPTTRYVVAASDDETGFANLEFGAFAITRLHRLAELRIRFGLIVPTADDDFAGRFTNLVGIHGRPTDLVTAVPDAVGLRLSASPCMEYGLVFGCMDVGFDFVFITEEVPENRAQWIRLNAACGVHLGPVDVTVEAVNLGNIGEGAPRDSHDRFLHHMTLGVSMLLTWVGPYLGFGVPLDAGPRGNIWVLTLGIVGGIERLEE